MKIAVVCANGKAGKLIVKEAVDRGHDVTAVVRSENQTVAQHTLAKDLFDLTSEDLAGFDAVVDAFGAWTPETLSEHSTSLAHLCDILSGTETRLLVVGGAGSLYVNPEHTAVVADGPEFPRPSSPWPPRRERPSKSSVHAMMCAGRSSPRRPTSRPMASAPAPTSWRGRSCA